MIFPAEQNPLLVASGLSVSFGRTQAVSQVSLAINQGEIVGVVGESGSGKSTLLRAIAHLLPKTAHIDDGSILFCGEDITRAPEAKMRTMRGGSIAYLFQNGQLSLDPLYTVESQFNEVLKAHGKRMSAQEKEQLLLRMGINDAARVLKSIPSELSGGLCQRVVMAFALAGQPRLLLADEPTSALDVGAQSQVASLLREANTQLGMAILLVGHDIEFVASLASRIAVMKNGHIVECAGTKKIMTAPEHAYTKELIASIPRETRAFKSVFREESAGKEAGGMTEGKAVLSGEMTARKEGAKKESARKEGEQKESTPEEEVSSCF